MTTKIIEPGTDVYRATCGECGCRFTYERSDVRTNYVRGGEEVSCPHCGSRCSHFGASGSRWPDMTKARRGCYEGRN